LRSPAPAGAAPATGTGAESLPRRARLADRIRPGRRGDSLGRTFGVFWLAVVCSDLADGIFRVVMPLLALALTRSPLAVSAVGLAVRLPWLVVTLPAGVVIDRHPPRTAMRCAAAARLPLIAITAGLAFGHVLPVWGLAAASFAVASAGTFVDISAQSMLPRLLTATQLRGANQRLQSTQRLASQLVGPAIGGYAAALGFAWGPVAAAALYLAAVGVLALVPGRAPDAAEAAPPTAQPGATPPAGVRPDTAQPDGVAGPAGPGRPGALRAMLAELRAGTAYFRQRPDLARIATVAGLANLSLSMCLTILPIWAVAPGPLKLGRGGYGLMLGALAAGGLAAGLIARPVLAQLSDRLLLRWTGPMVGVGLLAIAIPNVAVVCAVLAYAGAIAMLYSLTVISYCQTTIPRELFGRAFAAYKWITWGSLPIGSVLAGLTAELGGTASVFIVAGLLPTVGGTLLALGRFRLAGTVVPATDISGSSAPATAPTSPSRED
jgi:Major Facilitator Superfamily